MKKIILTSALALAIGMTAGAKTADELRIYINPGHGSWTANDRPCTLVGHGAYSRTNTDTLSFFESNTNLRKGFGLLELLRSYGLKFDPTLNQEGDRHMIGAARDMSNNIVMSHVKCGPYHDDNGTVSQLGDNAPEDIYYYNRDLSEITMEVDANNFDMFISIHSNAASEGSTTNYPLFLYRGYDTPVAAEGLTLEHQTVSRAMADKCWDYAYSNRFGMWSAYSSSKNIRGDVNFYGSGSTSSKTGAFGYLGVLKSHVPGFLVEGYFHTYQPARHRAMNWDVCYVEGQAYGHGIADYFGLNKETTGVIYGVVRDLNEKFKDAAYSPNPTTEDAYLPLNGATVTLKKDGNVVKTYTTDNYYNGAYVFFDVEPGTYTIEATHPDYLETDPVEVTVTACGLAQPTVSLVNKSWEPPTVVYNNYDDPVNNPAFAAADEYSFEQQYVDEEIPALADKTIRRVVARDGKLYILALSKEEKPAPTLVVYDAKNKALLAEVSTEGTTGDIRDLSDIQVTADGILVGVNENENHYSTAQSPTGVRGLSRFYRWNNDENGVPTGDPIEWFTSPLSGNMYYALCGHTMAYSGTMEDGKIIIPAITNSAGLETHKMFFNVFTILDGEVASANFKNSKELDATYFTKEFLGDNFTFTTSPTDKDCFITTSSLKAPRIAKFEEPQTVVDLNAEVAGTGYIGAGFMKYAGHNYMVAADNAEGANNGMRIIDIKNATDAAQVSTINTALAAATDNAVCAGESEADVDDDGIATNAHLALYAVRDGKVSYLTTRGAEQPVNKKEFAYGLSMEENDGVYTLGFSLTGDVVAANVVLTPTNGEAAVVVPVANPAKGANTVEVDAKELSENTEYNWGVEVQSKSIAQPGEVYADNNGLTNYRGGVTTFRNPELESFGYTGVCVAGAMGLDVYNPAGEKVVTRALKNNSLFSASGAANTSSPMAAAARGNDIIMASWGDTSYGLVAANILDPENEPYSVFAGTKASNGLVSYNGVGLGSGTPGVGYYEDGENSRLYTFDEDLFGNNVALYNIGTAKQVTEAPTNLGFKSMLANTNVDFQPVKNGCFISQVRGAGNNTTGCPGFMYIDLDGNVLFQSSTVEGMNAVCKAIAVNKDENLIAVGENQYIGVYDLSFDDKNVPNLALRYRYKIATSVTEGDMEFDYAGNLHYYQRNGNGYHVYSLTEDSPKVTTPAKAEYVIKGAADAVDNIAVDAADNEAEAIYYNLNGIRVSADNLVPGVYVKVQGSTTTKVVVK